VRTVVGGDNYATEHVESLSALVVQEVQQCQADLFVAGPCFEAGRYGMAAGALCKAVKAALGVPVTTSMAVENPGVDMYRSDIYIVDSGTPVQAMRDVLTTMARLAWKFIDHQAIGRPGEEGYIPPGDFARRFCRAQRCRTPGGYGVCQDHRTVL
jgi:betaine reductase